MRTKISNYIIMAAVVLLSSCAVPKNITYFQDAKAGTEVLPIPVLDVRVKPQDKLSIYVTADEPELARPFNLNGGMNGGGGMSMTGSNSYMCYTITPEGNVEFPGLGTIHLEGMTRSEIASYIAKQLQTRELLKNPIVTVEYANTGFTTLGALGGGRVEFNRDHLNIIDAIAMAGDLPLNARRDNIRVFRQDNNGRIQTYQVNLLDLEELSKSPVYWIQQDDIIYADYNDMTKLGTTPYGTQPLTHNFWLGLVTTTISFGTMIWALTKK